MPLQKGHKKMGGRKKGTPNKRTEQWEKFVDYCMTGGLERFEQELNSLEGKDFVYAFQSLLEYHKPKLARVDTNIISNKFKITITKNGTDRD